MQEEIRNFWLYQVYNVFQQYDTGIKVDYIVLLLILALCTVLTGISLSSIKNRHYWLNAFPLILMFSLIEGLRYLRGTDYLNYALLYKYHGEGVPIEMLYNILQSLFYFLELPYWAIFVVYAFIWIVALLYLFKRHKSYILYGLPIFILLGLNNFECFIRQNIAFAVIFVFLAALMEHRYKKALFCAVMAFLIHSSSVVFILYILAIYWICQRKQACLSPVIVISLYFLSTFVLESQALGWISEIIKLIPIVDGTVLSPYIANAANRSSADAVKDKFARSLFTKVGAFVFDSLVVYWSYKKLKHNNYQDKNIVFLYNLYVVSLIWLQLFFVYEIPKRIFGAFYMFAAFLIAYIMKKPKLSKFELLSQCVIFMYLIVFFVKNILMASNQLFVWDAKGIYNFYL